MDKLRAAEGWRGRRLLSLCASRAGIGETGPIQEGGDQELVAALRLGDEQGEGRSGEDNEDEELPERMVEIGEDSLVIAVRNKSSV